MIRPTRHPRPTGFTLVEILIVISIIGLLAGLVIGGAMQMRKGADDQKTKVLVNQVAGILSEYQAAVKKYPDNTDPVTDADPVVFDYTNADDAESVGFFLQEIRKLPAAQTAISGIAPDLVRKNTAGVVVAIVDSWGKPLRYSGFNAAGAGTDDDYWGNRDLGMPRKRQPYIASAGPDQLWGRFDPSASGEVPDAQAADNIYSFDQK